jgi:hypothetical protein
MNTTRLSWTMQGAKAIARIALLVVLSLWGCQRRTESRPPIETSPPSPTLATTPTQPAEPLPMYVVLVRPDPPANAPAARFNEIREAREGDLECSITSLEVCGLQSVKRPERFRPSTQRGVYGIGWLPSSDSLAYPTALVVHWQARNVGREVVSWESPEETYLRDEAGNPFKLLTLKSAGLVSAFQGGFGKGAIAPNATARGVPLFDPAPLGAGSQLILEFSVMQFVMDQQCVIR